MKIDVRSAVISAKEYLENLQDIMGTIDDILLEEVELSENKSFWYVTLSFKRPVDNKEKTFIPDVDSLTAKYERHYKVFTVDTTTGEINSMKIRSVNS